MADRPGVFCLSSPQLDSTLPFSLFSLQLPSFRPGFHLSLLCVLLSRGPGARLIFSLSLFLRRVLVVRLPFTVHLRCCCTSTLESGKAAHDLRRILRNRLFCCAKETTIPPHSLTCESNSVYETTCDLITDGRLIFHSLRSPLPRSSTHSCSRR